MGQAGAQREPSMEEILASIRRIIESNEPGQDGHTPVDMYGDYDRDGGEDDDVAVDDIADVADEAFPTSKEEAKADKPAAQPVSLADVAARVRGAPQMSPPEAPAAETAPADPRLVTDDTALENFAAEELRRALVADNPSTAAQSAETPAARTVEDDEQDSAADNGAQSPESSGQLVSLHTGEKVAAAFEELDAAIAAGRTRSFDEIAEEMLRPMLTQWLDDNLPTLVERLVREEIERVARGNRR